MTPSIATIISQNYRVPCGDEEMGLCTQVGGTVAKQNPRDHDAHSITKHPTTLDDVR